MATYTIIGGDKKEYGPVSADEVRQWIAEGRLSEQSQIKAAGAAEFRPLGSFPEFAEAFGPKVPPPSARPSPIGPASRKEHDYDYDLDIGGCISRGWNLLKENFGTLFVCFLIVVILEIAFGGMLNLFTAGLNKILAHTPGAFGFRLGYNFFITAVMSLVMGPLMGGLFLVYLKKIRQQQTSVGEVFAGFSEMYLQLFLGAMMVSLISGLCMLPFNIVWLMKTGPLLEQMQLIQSNPTAMQNLLPKLIAAFTSSLPVFLVCLIPATYLTVCWQFTLPLIIDKQIKFGAAMKTSFRMVNKHWWQVFGLTVVASLVSLSGIVACCVGVVFTAPIGMAALMFAYEIIFSERQTS